MSGIKDLIDPQTVKLDLEAGELEVCLKGELSPVYLALAVKDLGLHLESFFKGSVTSSQHSGNVYYMRVGSGSLAVMEDRAPEDYEGSHLLRIVTRGVDLESLQTYGRSLEQI